MTHHGHSFTLIIDQCVSGISRNMRVIKKETGLATVKWQAVHYIEYDTLEQTKGTQ